MATVTKELRTQAITNSTSGSTQPYIGYAPTVGSIAVSSTETFGEGSVTYGVPGYATTVPNVNLVITDTLVTKYGTID